MSAPSSEAARPLALPDKVAFLRHPDAYPERPEQVEVRETHLSFVFLTPTRAYKMKKPVAHEFVDLRTPERRRDNCLAEVALNRRLAPDVYLGVVALTQEASGALALDGAGAAVEWLVCMRRLPATAMMDHLIAQSLLRRADIAAVAQRLGEFFAAQPAAALTAEWFNAHLRSQLDASVRLLARAELALPRTTIAFVHDLLSRYLDAGTELAARVRGGRIVEGHGDLRPEHICIATPPIVIDCLEFSRDLRLVDPFDEIAFLGLECARLGAPGVGPAVRRSVAAILDDRPPARLSLFYTALRACVRARLAIARLLEPGPTPAQHWRARALDYLSRAQRACIALDRLAR